MIQSLKYLEGIDFKINMCLDLCVYEPFSFCWTRQGSRSVSGFPFLTTSAVNPPECNVSPQVYGSNCKSWGYMLSRISVLWINLTTGQCFWDPTSRLPCCGKLWTVLLQWKHPWWKPQWDVKLLWGWGGGESPSGQRWKRANWKLRWKYRRCFVHGSTGSH